MQERERKERLGLVLLKCPKCDYIQEEQIDFYEKHIGFAGHPYTCPKCEEDVHVELVKLKNWQELKTDFQDAEELLEKICPHPKSEISDWMEEWWAIGHGTGCSVRVCNYCRKEMDRQLNCSVCGKVMTGYTWKKGDGIRHSWGLYYCEECWKKPKEDENNEWSEKNEPNNMSEDDVQHGTNV